MVKVCPNCGFYNDDTAIACLKCGYPLSEVVLAELPIVISSDGKSVFSIQITRKSLVISRNDNVKVPPNMGKNKLNALLGISLAEFTGVGIVSILSNFLLGIIIGLLVADILLLLPAQGKDLSGFIRKLQLEGQRLFIMKYEMLGNCNACEVLDKDNISELKISREGNSCVISVKTNKGKERKFYVPNLNATSLYNFLVKTAWRDKLVIKV